ncbi:serine hydrolase FSH [Nemania sp. FL0916]|nr:serine hydrolase FSH [Nemania sp. FL0916]
MHFLCLHGMGTNSKVFESQTAALRYALGDHHTYEFVEGVMKTEIAPDLKGIFSENDQYFQYFDVDDAPSCRKAASDLEHFIAAEGPFDGVLAFSQGAALAATLMAQRWQRDPVAEAADPIFKCAIFFGAGLPCDPASLQGEHPQGLSAKLHGEVIHVPTTHVWGQKDPSPYPPMLADLCKSELRQVYIHEGGHGIPGLQNGEALRESVRVIQRSISLAKRASGA